MISLSPPYHVLAGHTLLPDHADDRRFYVLPPAPALAREPDGRPAFSLLQFLGGGPGAERVSGGLLTLTTVLETPDAVLAELAGRLADRVGGTGGPIHLSPVAFDSGTVELLALGGSSGAAGDDDTAGPAGASPTSGGTSATAGSATEEAGTASGTSTAVAAVSSPFDIRFLGAGRPSLGGDNRAVFQLLLDEAAAELVEHALEAPDLPILAIYRLRFAALRPSYAVNVQADWSEIYHSLEQKAKANAWIVAADAEHMVESTLTEHGVLAQTDVLSTGAGSAAAAERARKQLMDWVFERFFVPQADPAGATANSIGKVVDDTVWSLVRSVLPGVGYRLREREDRELRHLSARMEESVAEAREVIPQGTLGGMLNRYRVDDDGEVREDWPDRRARLLTKVGLDGFPRLEVRVAVEDRFASDGLAQVKVDLERRGAAGAFHDPKSFVFRSAAETEVYIVNLLGAEPADLRSPYRYRTIVTFDPTGPFGPRPALTSDWVDGQVVELFVEPRVAYRVTDVTVETTPLFSYGLFPAVTGDLRYRDGSGGAEQHGRVSLAADRPTAAWRFASFGEGASPYEYRLTYHRDAASGGPIETAWATEVEGWLSIPDPMPVKRPLNIFTSLAWPDVAVAFVQVRYDDPEHGIQFEEQIDLSADTPFLTRTYPIHADGARTLAYRLTVLLRNGGLLEGSWRLTDDDRLVIDRTLVDVRRVTVRALGGSLVEHRLRSVEVELTAIDPTTGAKRQTGRLAIAAGAEGEALAWEYLLGDPPARTVKVRAIFIDTNGFVTEPTLTTPSDLVVVQLRTKTVTA